MGRATSHIHRGLSWDNNGGKSVAAIAIVALFLSVSAPTAALAVTEVPDEAPVEVIVRETTPSTEDAERLVEDLGGAVDEQLGLIGGFTAVVPADAVADLEAHPWIETVTPDSTLEIVVDQSQFEELSELGDWEGIADATAWEDDQSDPDFLGHSLYEIARSVRATNYWRKGYDGTGVDVAVIDSGVTDVNGLTYPGKVVNGPDLSFESQDPNLIHDDTFGHGTHMAGIIAGRADSVTYNPKFYKRRSADDPEAFVGIAPGAGIVSVKVAGSDGATDVSQVIAAIDWIVQHKNDNGMNIRVLNLSFGTRSSQPYLLDPLAFAVEQAWNAGIVVVVAVGNDGNWAKLRNPALDPFVIAVGATDHQGTRKLSDDRVTSFTNCGTWDRHVDIVAPGVSIRSLRAPGSSADTNHPGARVGTTFFKGTGTSQAAAVVSGAAALVLDERPNATPDQVKALLMDNARSLRHTSELCQGDGALHLGKVKRADTPNANQNHPHSNGTGSLEASRGNSHVTAGGVRLEGEQDIHGNPWEGTSWSTAAALGTSWSGGEWNGTSWTGTSWSSGSWSGTSWTGTSWTGTSWTSGSWSGTSWTGTSWTSTFWR